MVKYGFFNMGMVKFDGLALDEGVIKVEERSSVHGTNDTGAYSAKTNILLYLLLSLMYGVL